MKFGTCTGFRLALVVVWVSVFAQSASRASSDIEMFVLGKQHNFEQTGTGNPTEESDSYSAFVSLLAASETAVESASLTIPGTAEPLVLQQSGSEWDAGGDAEFQSKAQLDAEAPNGTYSTQIVTQNQGTVEEDLTLDGDNYPLAPHIKNYSAMQSFDPDQPLTLAWDPWSGGTSDDVIRIELEHGGEMIYETMELNGTDTSVELPDELFEAGRVYEAQVMFVRIADSFALTRAAMPTGMALYLTRTKLDIRTQVNDIAVSELAASTDQAVVGSSVQLTATVENLGTTDAQDIEVHFENAGTDLGSRTISLASGGSGTVVFDWSPASAGTYDQLIAYVSSGDDNGGNDQAACSTVEVLAAPSPLPDLITQIGIFSGIEYGNPDIPEEPLHVFSLEVEEAGNTIQALTLSSPGTAEDIEIQRLQGQADSQLPDGQNLDIEVWYDSEDDRTAWEIAIEHASAMDDLFGAGTYTITAEFLDGATKQTDVWFGSYTDQGEPAGTDLDKPTQIPALNSPQNLAIIPSGSVVLSWDAADDPNVGVLHLYAENLATETQLLDQFYSNEANARSENLSINEEGFYVFEFVYANAFGLEQEVLNSDGIPVVGAQYIQSDVRLLVDDDTRQPIYQGWTLLGVFADTDTQLADMLPDAVHHPAFGWDPAISPAGGYAGADPKLAPAGESAYWVFCNNEAMTAPFAGNLTDNRANLSSGWNLVAPSHPGMPPDHPNVVSPIWTWDGASQTYRIVGIDEWMTPGMAYWIYATQSIPNMPLSDN